MATDPSQSWPGSEERRVVKEMLDDRSSPHWGECRRYIAIYLQKSGVPAEHLDDIAQDAMMAVMHGLKNFRFECSLTYWLKKVAKRRTIDWYRKAHKKLPNGNVASLTEIEAAGETKASETVPTIEENYLRDEAVCEIRDALADYARSQKNPERIRFILQRVLFQRDRQTEVAKSLGMTSARVNQIVREAERYVREKMGRGPDFDPPAPPKPSS